MSKFNHSLNLLQTTKKVTSKEASMVRTLRCSVIVVSLIAAAGCATDVVVDSTYTPEEMLDALERDLGQTRPQIEERLRAEAMAVQVLPGLQASLDAEFGGAWMNAEGTALVVGITDPARADEVRAAGGEPQVVRWSLDQLELAIASAPATVDPVVHAWRVDVPNNRVVVTTEDPSSPAVAQLVAAIAASGGLDASAVAVEQAAERPRPLYDIRGGDEYIINRNTLCSMGFAVNGGFVTAGHCGRAGSPTDGSNWVAQGVFRGSTFPGNDFAWVELNSNWASLPYVGNHAGGQVEVRGSAVAAVGSSICRSGRTTGWRCGTVQAHNVTINYAAGPVYGATQTNACAEGGDSGGSFISGNQAQGVTSGGSGNCSSGGTTFFQPVNPILSNYGLSLKTVGGGGGAKEIVSNWNGKCIDVPGSNFADGQKLQMWDCNGTGAQKWTFTGGTVQAGGKCMDVAWGNTASGTEIQIANCSGNRAQQFVLSAAGDLVSVLANKCVDIAGWNNNSGARLIIWDCHGGANQKWHLR
jgi:streptogrisin C